MSILVAEESIARSPHLNTWCSVIRMISCAILTGNITHVCILILISNKIILPPTAVPGISHRSASNTSNENIDMCPPSRQRSAGAGCATWSVIRKERRLLFARRDCVWHHPPLFARRGCGCQNTGQGEKSNFHRWLVCRGRYLCYVAVMIAAGSGLFVMVLC